MAYQGQKYSWFDLRNPDMPRFNAVSNLYSLCYTRESVKREENTTLQCEQHLYIYSSYATLPSFLMLQCTVWILRHDLTNQQHNSYQDNHATLFEAQYSKALPDHHKIYHHHLTACLHIFCYSWCRCLSVTPLPTCFPQHTSFLHVLSSLTSCGVTVSPR